MNKNFLTLIALVSVFALMLAGCGSQEAAETTAAAPAASSTEATLPHALGLTEYSLSTATWSSPDGATVYLTAVPGSYAEGQTATFLVRLEGEEIAASPCTWDGKAYTASAELSAADGLCYYVLMTGADGNTVEIPVNTPNVPTDETLINLAASLESYCSLTVESSAFADDKLTINAGTAKVQVPKITNQGEAITITEATLVLSAGSQELASQKLTLAETESIGAYQLTLTELSFDIPEMEEDQQLVLALNVTLSNGQSMTATGGTFAYTDGELLTTVG